ncbi:MAG TPA: peptidase S16 [Alphaproteobacteria bacterium]|jgi:Lon protease-like protein|nr:peptidase S16 [Alphaproteobacteria bacterium]HAM47755.1 peptidase S16 [Alphaproteobacteria bacterium]HBC53629.1 peptidase S16 [Alphaproteobacteria bacterium]HBF99763.1 peptidase S16 [Alphaproteobacteria bacterium]HCO89353.1 peptidase S16 [Alphaproteobacteria bacterium]
MAINALYQSAGDLPEKIAVFPLARALVLPQAQLPLNIFEPRYLAMIDDTIGSDRVIGMIQPSPTQPPGGVPTGSNGLDKPVLCNVGCLARISSFRESGDGRYFIILDGICRFAIVEEMAVTTLYRQVRADYAPFAVDLENQQEQESQIDRQLLLDTLRGYLEQRHLSADWKEIEATPTAGLVNSLTMSCPFEIAEKQALLEAPTLVERNECLLALLQMASANTGSPPDNTPLQ